MSGLEIWDNVETALASDGGWAGDCYLSGFSSLGL